MALFFAQFDCFADQAEIVLDTIRDVLPPIYESPLVKLVGGTTTASDLLISIAEFNYYTNQFSELLPIISQDVSLVVKYGASRHFEVP